MAIAPASYGSEPSSGSRRDASYSDGSGAGPSDKTTEFIANYRRTFTVVPADTPDLQQEAFRLRYQVYCVENDFEDPADNPGEMETDAFDERSAHALLLHRPTDQFVGTVRLALPNRQTAEMNLPINEVCSTSLLRDGRLYPPVSTGEISRFCISKDFLIRQRRLCRDQEKTGADRRNDRNALPFITLGLMNAIVRMSVANGVTHWCAVMEPSLIRLLARLGIHFHPLSSLIEYHGYRQPCAARGAEILEAIRAKRAEAWHIITASGALELEPNAALQGQAPELEKITH